ncbi:MAG TPA: ribosome small subunit-dependent GTPase A [Chitinophagales bacterium]|nr:ribosome small subunit-dependent GTPase A [Chitinophagales bacterium]HNI55757.1 ribosome small subunit-dependent GTPase A [Chitinophagales bacterium]HNJ90093.1 ribosome small subunit-dependent GTPase A [Chitinophagales bacterium]HNK98393.1 ribosome small subunit-dependent GTPase A [Chitinophagales bacterium]HNM30792.1 ribosome small subunit-dependent GTPase A [Chitinophagales bacterium]
MQGLVIQSTGSFYDVQINGQQMVTCRLKGRLRLDDKKQTNPVAVGDLVEVEQDEKLNYQIAEVHPRRNYIIRSDTHRKHIKQVIAANIDQTVVVASLRKPRTAYGFIDRVLLTSEVYDIPAVVIFNKHDLYDDKDNALLEELMYGYKDAGYDCFSTSVTNREHVEEIYTVFHNKTSLITGPSGAGKSSLVNMIEPDLNLRIGEISKYTEKGQHTTTFARMHHLPHGGAVIDTPGIKEFGLVDIDAEEVSHFFPEMRNRIGTCRFNNCLHINEDGCAIKDMLENGELSVQRYTSYFNFYHEIKEAQKW